MTVSTTATSGTVVGSTVAIGGAAGTGADASHNLPDILPFTGLDHVALIVAIGLLTILAGLTIIGLARRHGLRRLATSGAA